jgi:predicted O-methyltransferase YrrM
MDRFTLIFWRAVSNRLKKYAWMAEAQVDQHFKRESGIPHVDSIRTDTDRTELMALYHLASSCPPEATALEIGSYLGASSCYLVAGLSKINGHLYCVDTWRNETMPEGARDTYAEFLMNTKRVHQWITPIRKRSSEVTVKDIPAPIHLAFIDGDHCYDAVKHDFTMVKDRLATDGIIAFHDFGYVDFEGVSRVLGEALASGEWMMEGMIGNLAWITPARWTRT